jgi:flavodoxin
MKAMVVYDSVFGNTEQIARAVASGLGSPDDVGLYRVSEVKPEQLNGVRLLLVGSPTRGFRPTPATSALLKSLPQGALQGMRVAGFDTRMILAEVHNAFLTFMVGIFGYAAEPIAKQLVKKGGALAVPAEGFFVKGSEGPLKDGELERAAAWAKKILG